MKYKGFLYRLLAFVFISQLLSCNSINLVVVNRKKTSPGTSFFKTTYISEYKKGYNDPKHERTYFLHQGDTVYQIDSARFEPVFKGNPKKKNQAVDWYTKHSSNIHITGVLMPVESEAYNFYLNTSSIDGNKYLKSDLKHCYQTHFFADTVLYSKGDSVSLREQNIESASISAASKIGGTLALILIPSILVGGSLLTLIVIFFVKLFTWDW